MAGRVLFSRDVIFSMQTIHSNFSGCILLILALFYNFNANPYTITFQGAYLCSFYIFNSNPCTVIFQGAGAYPRSSGHNCCRNTPGQVPHLRAHPWRSSVEVPEPLQEPQPHHSPGHSGLLTPSYAHILYRAAPRLALSAHAMWLWHGGYVRFVHPFQLWRKRAHAQKMLWTKMDVWDWEETSLQDKSPPPTNSTRKIYWISPTKLTPKIWEPVPKCPNQCKQDKVNTADSTFIFLIILC